MIRDRYTGAENLAIFRNEHMINTGSEREGVGMRSQRERERERERMGTTELQVEKEV